MIKNVLFFFFLMMMVTNLNAQQNNAMLFDDGWKFYRGAAQGAEDVGFNDAGWRNIDLPHDWGIEDLPGTHSPFSENAISQVSGGFTTGGTGWYRKMFLVPGTDKGKKMYLKFDGVYMNADVWINGSHLGNHPYGYTGFEFDISEKIKYGEENVVAVEVKNEGVNSRWYSGSGIYRHVWLTMAAPVHIVNWSTFIVPSNISNNAASVNFKTIVLNETAREAAVHLVTKFINSAGVTVAVAESKQSIAPKTSYQFIQDAAIKKPQLWQCDNPVLYTAITQVYNGEVLLGADTVSFGIRSIHFDIANGFQLNGKPMKLKGGCLHHDNGPLGARAYDRAEERRVELLKASGYNAVRCSHNPPSPAFLNACDRLGMLVMDEAFDMWDEGKNPYDYHLYFKDWWQKDVDAMVTRDRNHPCIIMWSIGNEIPERASAQGVATAKMLSAYIKKLDGTRPVTSAVNGLNEDKDPYFAQLDIGGYNYAVYNSDQKQSLYETDHRRVPSRIMLGTESYPLEAFGSWMDVVDHPYVIGDFVWTAFDYIGEASIGWLGYFQKQQFFPWNLAYCGDIDICGWKRPQSYYRDALWKDNQLSIFVTPPVPSFTQNPKREDWSKWHWLDAVANWNWTGYEDKPLEVVAYSSCAMAELFLNNKSLGKKETNRVSKFMASWKVPYQPGILKVVGYNKANKIINTSVLNTATAATTIHMEADRQSIKANNQDLCYITVELQDDKANRNPLAENKITFKTEGNATIVGIGNANPMGIESYQATEKKAWQGRCLVIIKAGKKAGEIKLAATSDGIKPASIIIHAVQ